MARIRKVRRRAAQRALARLTQDCAGGNRSCRCRRGRRLGRSRIQTTKRCAPDTASRNRPRPHHQHVCAGYFLLLSKSQRSERWKWEICITTDDLSFPGDKFSFPKEDENAAEFDRISSDSAEWFWKVSVRSAPPPPCVLVFSPNPFTQGEKDSEKTHMALIAFLQANINKDENFPSQSAKKWKEQMSVREAFEYESEVFDAFDEGTRCRARFILMHCLHALARTDDSGEAEEFKKDADAVAKQKMPATPKERSDQKKPRASLKGVVDNMKETVWSSQQEDDEEEDDEQELLRQMKQIQKDEARIKRRKVEVEEKQKRLKKKKQDQAQSKTGAKALLEVWDTMKLSMKKHRITVDDFMENCGDADQLSELIFKNRK